MRWIIVIVGILVFLTGGTFFLQGIGILPGELMHGQTIWAIIGFVMVVGGAAICYYGFRPRTANPTK